MALVRIDRSDPRPEPLGARSLPKANCQLDHAAVFSSCMVAKHYRDNLGARISICDLDGRPLSKRRSRQPLARSGSGATVARTIICSWKWLIISVQGRIERLELCDRQDSRCCEPSAARHDLSDAVVRQVFVTSRDGTTRADDLDPPARHHA